MDIHTRRPYVCTLGSETLEKARRELNEDPETRQQKIDELRAKFKRDRPDIKLPPDDAFLVRFLRCKKFYIDRAFKMLEHYYEVRRKYPEVFAKFRPSAFKHVYELGVTSILPGRDPEGRKIVAVSNLGAVNPDNYDINEGLASFLVMMEKMLQDEETQVNGMVVLGDYEELTAKLILKQNMSFQRKQMDILVNAMPMRFKAGHYIREPEFFGTLFAMVKPLISAKMKSRLHFHGKDFGTLHNYLPSSLLPPQFGGSLMDFNQQDFYTELLKCDAEYDYMNQFGIPKDCDILGGVKQGADASGGIAGSFKKLSVD